MCVCMCMCKHGYIILIKQDSCLKIIRMYDDFRFTRYRTGMTIFILKWGILTVKSEY